MIGPQVQISSWYRSYTPLSLRGECLGFIVGRCGHDDLITVDVGGSGGGSCKLRLFFGLLLYLSDLLPLLRGCWDLHTQNDVSDLRLGQGSYIHAREETDTLLLDRRRVRLVFKAKGNLNVIVWRFKLKAINLLVLFAIIGQDEIFQCNLYNRKEKEKKFTRRRNYYRTRDWKRTQRKTVNWSTTVIHEKRKGDDNHVAQIILAEF